MPKVFWHTSLEQSQSIFLFSQGLQFYRLLPLTWVFSSSHRCFFFFIHFGLLEVVRYEYQCMFWTIVMYQDKVMMQAQFAGDCLRFSFVTYPCFFSIPSTLKRFLDTLIILLSLCFTVGRGVFGKHAFPFFLQRASCLSSNLRTHF